MISPNSIVQTLRYFGLSLVSSLLALALTVIIPTLSHAITFEPQLNEKVLVSGPLVTLDDLFKNAGIKGSTAVFRSPDPGTTGKISVKRILLAAQKHDLKIKEKSAFFMVTVTRSSRVIDLEELEGLIRGRLEGKYTAITGQLVIKLPVGLKELHVAPDIQGELSLSSLDWSSRSGRFTARFALGDADPIILKGSAIQMIEVVVAKTAIESGAMLSHSDIKMKMVRADRGRTNAFSGPKDVIGLSATRRLLAGKPIKISDLEQPKLIRKNQLVTILLEVPGLILRTEGKALGDAAKGETVKVLNTQSKRIIHGTAKASGLVTVSLSGSIGSDS